MADETPRSFSDRLAVQPDKPAELVAAATVILLRDSDDGLETLMLRKNSKIAFGGMWVFPGGRIDDDDGSPDDPMEERARLAAVREAEEEASLDLDPDGLVWFSHWTPPPVEIRRFSTWFFAAPAPSSEVTIDDGEITDSRWLSPRAALDQQREGEIELVPPTFVTLHYLQPYDTAAEALAGLGGDGLRRYVTQIGKGDEGMVVMWEGDAGYDARDPNLPGARHRLTMSKQGYHFDDSGVA
ncbi:MAG: NUDIX domain-containing protein [Myxococcota bacterium]